MGIHVNVYVPAPDPGAGTAPLLQTRRTPIPPIAFLAIIA